MIYTYFLMFIIYSFVGWCIESFGNKVLNKKFVNRGFLIGPYCPIYGVGCLLVLIFLKRFKNNFILLLFLLVLVFSILEYLTSYILEKLFNTRWWDYSDKKFNINGRICLETMIPFTIGGLLLIYVLDPFISSSLSKIPSIVRIILALLIFIIFMVDCIITLSIMKKIKKNSTSSGDSTEIINAKVKEYLKTGKILDRRLIEAYPDMRIVVTTKDRVIESNKKYKLMDKKLKNKKNTYNKKNRHYNIR